MRLTYVFQTIWLKRRRIAGAIAHGPYGVWIQNIVRRRKAKRDQQTLAAWPPLLWPQPKRQNRRHRYPSWIFQQGPYWINQFRLAQKQKRDRRTFIPPPPYRRPTRMRRFPTWIFQQGPYWIQNVLLRRKQRLARTFIPPVPRRIKRRRFPTWVFQQGPYWITNTRLRLKQRRDRTFTSPLPRRQKHRWAAWFAPNYYSSWISNVRLRLKTRRDRTFIPPAPKRIKRRFLLWPGPYGVWIHRRVKKVSPQPVILRRVRRKVAAWITIPAPVYVFAGKHRKRPPFGIWPLPKRHHPKSNWTGGPLPFTSIQAPRHRAARKFIPFPPIHQHKWKIAAVIAPAVIPPPPPPPPAPFGRFTGRRGGGWSMRYGFLPTFPQGG